MRQVFFSWQTDAPPEINRYLIRDSLVVAIKGLSVAAELDEATRGVSGTPDIFTTILTKIDRCAVFVADLTLAELAGQREFTPNPNVLIEYGYALARVGDARIISIINKAFGPIEKLPFDLRHKAVRVTYDLPTDSDRDSIKKCKNELGGLLRSELRLILEDPKSILGISDDELAVARFLLKKSDTGQTLSYSMQEEIADGAGLSLLAVKRAVADLVSRSYVKRLDALGVDTPRVAPTLSLFWDLDLYVNGWDPRSDARLLAEELVSTSDSGHGRLATSKFREKNDWPLRRLNAALRYLMQFELVNHSKSAVPDVATSLILENEITRRFARGSIEPERMLRS